MADEGASIVGVAAFQRDVAAFAADRGAAAAALAQAGERIMQPVAGVTRSAVPNISGRLAGSVRVNRSRTGGTVRMGSAGVRYAGWVDFGGNRQAPHESSRAYTAQGRYLFPAAHGLEGAVVPADTQALQTALDGYRWTNSTSDGAAVHD
jgi:hypothetical protein